MSHEVSVGVLIALRAALGIAVGPFRFLDLDGVFGRDPDLLRSVVGNSVCGPLRRTGLVGRTGRRTTHETKADDPTDSHSCSEHTQPSHHPFSSLRRSMENITGWPAGSSIRPGGIAGSPVSA